MGWRGGTHRSWPGGRGGRPRALIPGKGVREGLAWRKGLACEWYHRSWLGGRGGQGGGARARRGCKGFGSGGVGGRDTGPRDGANFAMSFLTRTKRKMAFFGGCPVGWGGGVPTGAGLVALVAGEGWGGRRDDGSSKERGGGLVGCSKDQERGQGRVGLAVGGARASVAGG